MNTNTGNIISHEDLLKNNPSKEFLENFVDVNNMDMTRKQRETKQVSLKDHKSILGKKLTAIRKEKIVHRGDICPCGSGKIFKYCCANIEKSKRTF